jgi:hypothetical protein
MRIETEENHSEGGYENERDLKLNCGGQNKVYFVYERKTVSRDLVVSMPRGCVHCHLGRRTQCEAVRCSFCSCNLES